MKRYFSAAMAIMLFMSMVFFTGSVSTAKADESKVLQFNTMVGVPRPYTGSANAIRGVPGGGLPWVIEFGKGKLSPDGTIDVSVRGLVLDPNDPAVPVDRRGVNPIPNFIVIVSCLSKDADGNPTTVNIPTALFPADAAGNSQIQDTIGLPSPCIAPIIFVTSPGGAWFASTGF